MSGFELPNTTPVPNEIIDGWMQKLKGSELKVLLLVVRKTLGWIADKNTGMRKEEDWLSYSQLKIYTGLSSRPLSSAIDALVNYGLIQIRDKKGSELGTKKARQAVGRKRLKLYYRLNMATLEKTSRYFKDTGVQSKQVPTTLQKSSALVYKVKTTKSNTLQNQIPLSIAKRTSLKSLTEEDLLYVAEFYQVPLAFVKSKYDDLINYCERRGRVYKDYLAALRNFVKQDALKIRKENSGKRRISFVDPA